MEFAPKTDEQLPTFTLTLSKKMTYDQFATKVAEQLKAEPTHIRFTTINNAGKAKTAVKYNPQLTLNNILFPGPYTYSANSMQKSDGLLYEVLDMSLKEMESRKAIKITWLPDGLLKEVCYPAVTHLLIAELTLDRRITS